MVCLISFIKTEFFVLFPVKCSVTCGSGIMTRSVKCSDKDVSCDARTKPPTSAPCGLEPCPQWTVGSWGKVNIHIDIFFYQRTLYILKFDTYQCFCEILSRRGILKPRLKHRSHPYLLVKKWKIEHAWTFCSRHTAMIRVRYMPPHFAF